ncbi:bifunctional phosphoribosylaminoimidazolecarboxamide formyltransferase/IMP cyclohydrolase [Candidatus Peribacteria bacterium]|nr:bifunctional phosphoribosylaminoimidazolecarboxamide formyltransferase/IMP cyclohydrolase [Candidatus Peribacteria bacterium]
MTKKRALLSVSDKTGLVQFARILSEAGYEIISTGGTFRELEKEKITVISAEEVTGFPECFGGRVKTMHPLIMGGILFNRDIQEHREQAEKLKIQPIDLVVVNLYPFADTVTKLGASSEISPEAIEQIDIGGPTLLRSAAKNHAAVTVVCDTADYVEVATQIQKNGTTTPELRAKLAAKVFAHTAVYDGMIAEYLSHGENLSIALTNGRKLRYGENPHQWGKFFMIGDKSIAWKQLQGKELSYLNILDADACWRMVSEFDAPTCVMVKHANPSGIASATIIEDAFQSAYDSDRLSAFGVIISLNRPCSEEIAKKILDQKIFVEVILAPEYEAGALGILKSKPNIRLLSMGSVRFSDNILYRSAFGGVLSQNDDTKEITEADLTCVTKVKPTKQQVRDLLFAWKVVKHAKSNAIVLAKDSTTVGIGCGQTSRVDSTWIALKRAGDKAKESVLASDAFFPFPDSIEEAAKHGIVAVIQPGGSIKDSEVFAKADELGIAMVTTGVRAFRH